MSNDELWELQQERWKELKQGFVELKYYVKPLQAWGWSSSKLWGDLEQIRLSVERLQGICAAITRTAWKEDQ